jgi:CRISPR/Cas system-associated endonuclease Cas1
VDNFERSIRSQERQGEAAPQGGEQDAKARLAELRVAEAEFKFQLAQRIGEIKIAELQAKSQQALALNDARGAAMAMKSLAAPALSYNERR